MQEKTSRFNHSQYFNFRVMTPGFELLFKLGNNVSKRIFKKNISKKYEDRFRSFSKYFPLRYQRSLLIQVKFTFMR